MNPRFLVLDVTEAEGNRRLDKRPSSPKNMFFFDRPILACQGAVFSNRKRGSTVYCILWCWRFFISLFNRVRMPEFMFFSRMMVMVVTCWFLTPGVKNKSDLSNGLNPLLWLHPFTPQQFLQRSFLKGRSFFKDFWLAFGGVPFTASFFPGFLWCLMGTCGFTVCCILIVYFVVRISLIWCFGDGRCRKNSTSPQDFFSN